MYDRHQSGVFKEIDLQSIGPPPAPLQDGSTLLFHKHVIQQWMHEMSNLPLQRDFVGVARMVNGQIVAAFGYDNFQPRGCQMHVSVTSASALNRELLYTAFDIPFNQWKYRYAAAIIPADNVKSIRLARRFGFTDLAPIPDELWYGVLYPQNAVWLKQNEQFNAHGPNSRNPN